MTPARTVPVYFYGSFIDRRVLAGHGFDPASVRIARLWGHDVAIDPLTRLVRSGRRCVYGVLCRATHEDLARLYATPWMEAYRPEPVVVELPGGRWRPALTYRPDGPIAGATPPGGYVGGIVAAARALGFPGWYVKRLERFAP